MDRRQALITEFWKRGRLKYRLWNDIQKKIEAKYQDVQARKVGFMFVNCTRGGGKTDWGVTKALECIRDPKLKRPQAFMATAFGSDLTTIIHPTFERVMEDKPRQLGIDHIPSKRMYIDRTTGGMVHYRGLDLKTNSLRGNYADVVIIEESQNVKSLAYLWNYVIKQLFRHRPNPICIFIGTPPETPDHAWVQMMELAKLPENDCYVEATIDEHNMMSDEEKKFLMKDLTEDAIAREFYCKVVIDKSRAIIPEWDERFCVNTEPDEFRRFYYQYVAMDLGVKNDFTAGLLFYYDFLRRTVVVEDEFEMRGPTMTTDQLAELIAKKKLERWPDNQKTYRQIADNNNPLLVNDLNLKYGMPFMTTDKSKLVYMVNKVRVMFRQNRIEINPRCLKLLGSLRVAIWNERRTEFERSEIFGHFDWLAALIYGVRNVDEISNPIPEFHGINLASPNTIIIPSPKRQILKRFGE